MALHIVLKPTHAGYHVTTDGEWCGSILLRVYEGNQRIHAGALAVSSRNDAKTRKFQTIGMALDYLIDTDAAWEEETP